MDLTALLGPVRRSFKQLEARVEALEKAQHTTLADAYQGVYQFGRTYERGALVTHSGSLWLALEDTDKKPASDKSNWRLIVKRGRDGKVKPYGHNDRNRT